MFSLAYGSVASELKSQGTKKTDSGVLKISEEGVKFRSYRDGSTVTLTPETSIQIQKKLGADIIIPFDELPPFHCSPEALQKSFQRTHRWQKRSLETHRKNPKNQAIYGVVHGGVNADLRAKSCKRLSNMGFDGYAIGGSLGKNREDLLQVLAYCMPNLAGSSVKHLLGIADIPSIEAGVPFGIDTLIVVIQPAQQGMGL